MVGASGRLAFLRRVGHRGYSKWSSRRTGIRYRYRPSGHVSKGKVSVGGLCTTVVRLKLGVRDIIVASLVHLGFVAFLGLANALWSSRYSGSVSEPVS